MDTLEKCLSSQPKETTRFDEAMNVKALLRELCQVLDHYKCCQLNKWIIINSNSLQLQFIDMPSENPMASQLKLLASKVLFALSLNNFNAVFSRISARYEKFSNI